MQQNNKTECPDASFSVELQQNNLEECLCLNWNVYTFYFALNFLNPKARSKGLTPHSKATSKYNIILA